MTVPDRFWRRVDRTPGHGPDGDCWVWTGTKQKKGYGRFYETATRMVAAHRYLFEALFGKLDRHPSTGVEGQCVCHTCDNPPCVNPDHLFVGTHKVNAEDRNAKGREARPKGLLNAAAVLTEHQVRRIRLAPGTHAAIAEVYGISPTAVGLIKRRQRWQHLT